MTDMIDFSEYGIYEKANGASHLIAICKEEQAAKAIARSLAALDPECDAYSYSIMARPDELIAGGGTSVTYQMQRSELI